MYINGHYCRNGSPAHSTNGHQCPNGVPVYRITRFSLPFQTFGYEKQVSFGYEKLLIG